MYLLALVIAVVAVVLAVPEGSFAGEARESVLKPSAVVGGGGRDKVLGDHAAGHEQNPVPPDSAKGASVSGCAIGLSADKRIVGTGDVVTVTVIVSSNIADRVTKVRCSSLMAYTDGVSGSGGVYTCRMVADSSNLQQKEYFTVRADAYDYGGNILCSGYWSAPARQPVVVGITGPGSAKVGESLSYTCCVTNWGSFSGDYSYLWTTPLGVFNHFGSGRCDTFIAPDGIAMAGRYGFICSVIDFNEGVRLGGAEQQIVVEKEHLKVTIFGPGSVPAGKVETWAAGVEGGKGPYDFYWWKPRPMEGIYMATAFEEDVGILEVQVTDVNTGVKGMAYKRVIVTEPKPGNLFVTVGCNKASVSVNESVTCTATVAGGVPPYNYTFAWGDRGSDSFGGIEAPTYSHSHKYGAAQPFTVTVKVVDDSGASGNGSASVTVTAGCGADEQMCGGECWPASWTCCGAGACPEGMPCCGNGCCAAGSYCVREGFCCRTGYQPCPDGQTCCTSVDLCHPDVTACCPPGTVPIPGSGGQCRTSSGTSVQGFPEGLAAPSGMCGTIPGSTGWLFSPKELNLK